MPLSTLARLQIALGLDSAGVRTGAGSVRAEMAGIQAEANQTQAAMNKAFGGIQGAALDVAKGLGLAFAAFKVGDFVAESIKGAQDEEAGIARLNASLDANVAVRAGATDAIEKQIAANQRLGFEDDATRDSLTGLLAATHNYKEAIADQNVAVDLARFKQISLQEASDALTKVEGGRFRLLAGLGIQLEANATKEQALAAVQAAAAGQAEKFANTSAGALARSAAAGKEFQDAIGAPLLSALAKVADAAAEAAKKLSEFVGAAGDLIDRAGRLGQSVADAGGRIPFLADGIDLVTGAFNRARTPGFDFIANAQASAEASKEAAAAAKEQAAAAADLGTAVDTLGIKSDTATDSALKLTGALREDERAAIAQAVAIGTAAGATDAQRAAAQAALPVFDKMQSVFDGFTGSVDKSAPVLDQFGFSVDGARGHVNDLKTAIDLLPQLTQLEIQVIIDQQTKDQRLKGRVSQDLGGLPGADSTTGGGKTSGEIAADEARQHLQDLANQDAANKTAHEKAIRDAQAAADKAARDAKAAAEKAASEQAAAYREKLGAAFDSVRHAAESYFSKLHELNLKAIKDAHDHANALLDAQKAANLAPVTEAQKAQDAIVQQRELAARQAALAAANAEQVGTGSGQVGADQKAADVLAATQALADFQATARIAAMQANADAANAAIDTQKSKNDQLAADATKAENDRASAQQAAFSNDLQALQASLSKHPETWAKTQQDILKLLMGYGVDYKKAATNLGKQYAAGLLSTTRDAEAAAAAVFAAGGGKLGVAPKPVNSGATSAAVAAGLGDLTLRVVIGPIEIDGEPVTQVIERRLAASFSRKSSGIGG